MCGAETRIVDSRGDGSTVWRRRECVRCGSRSTTFEVPEEIYESLLARQDALDRITQAKAALAVIEDIVKHDLPASMRNRRLRRGKPYRGDRQQEPKKSV